MTYIESPGGSAVESLNVISTMNGIHTPVVTYCRGFIGGAAAVIAAHGLKGFRTADPAAHFSLYQESDDSRNGRGHSHESYLKMLAQILSNDTAKPQGEVLQWLTEGAEFSVREALNHGLIDAIAGEPLLPKSA